MSACALARVLLLAASAPILPSGWQRRENTVTSAGLVMEAPDWPSFAVAIRRKVTLELAGEP